MRRSVRIALVFALVAGIGGGAVAYRKVLRWKRFAVVEPDVLYRSGLLADWQMKKAIESYGIKTVFSFTHTNNDGEQRLCEKAGVKRYFCYLSGDGVGSDDPYLRFLQVVQDPANHPVLVHCTAGVQRTGGAVALYRVLFQDWEFDRAIEEMVAMGNDGEAKQITQIARIHETLTQSAIASGDSRTQTWRR